MKLILYGTAPWMKTAYGKNMHYLMKYLGKKHEIACCSTYGFDGIPLTYEGADVFANHDLNLQGSVRWVTRLQKQFRADLIIQHFDSWVLPGDWISSNNLPIATYSPVDCDPLTKRHKLTIQDAKYIIAMSRFAQRMYRDNNLRSIYIPHGVDTSTYTPLDKETCKERLGLPTSSFIIGVVGTNLSHRKNLPNQLLAFKQLLRAYPTYKKDTFLYLHTYVRRDSRNARGYDLPAIIEELGLKKNVIFTEPTFYQEGFSEEDMNLLYNAFDVLSMCSLGEGFGIPIIEAGSCNVPSITTDFSSMGEVVGEGGIALEPDADLCWWTLDAWQKLVGAEKIADAYYQLRSDDELRQELGRSARKNAEKYDWEKEIIPMWLNFLEEVESS